MVASNCHGNETTPITLWNLQPMCVGGMDEERGRVGEEGGEEGVSSASSSQYNELWLSSSTVEMNTQMEGGEQGGEVEWEGGEGGEVVGEGGEEGDGVRENRGGNNVDGATGQSTIAKSVYNAKFSYSIKRAYMYIVYEYMYMYIATCVIYMYDCIQCGYVITHM